MGGKKQIEATPLETVEPIGKRVLIRKDQDKKQTKGGIQLPDNIEIPTITGRIITIIAPMADKRKNTWSAKIKRTLTSILPVSKRRKGQCVSCGACCRLPNVCPFLKRKRDGKFYCSIYLIRPLNCRKYPRTESEFITADTCGYKFE